MHPILFRLPDFLPWIGGAPVRSFGVMVALGFLAGLYFTLWQAKKNQIKPELIQDLFMWVIVGAILGARLMYVAVHPGEFKSLMQVLAIWNGGLVFYGGFFGAVLLGILHLRRKKAPILETADVCMPGGFLGLSIGRWGCLLVGDDYGHQTNVPWAIRFPDVEGSLMPKDMLNVPLHPTQIYMSLNALVIFLVLWLVLSKRSFPGQVFWLAFVLYSTGRFIIEFYRGDDQARGFLGPLSTSQWIGIPLFVLGSVMLIRGLRATKLSSYSS